MIPLETPPVDVHYEAILRRIASSSSTKSEIVVPVVSPTGRLLAVLDVDSDELAAFDETDRTHLEALCSKLGARFGQTDIL